MIDLTILRARIQELQNRDMKYAPERVRARWQFDLEALKELLAFREREGK